MNIARITLPGLAGMGVSVALLWGCLISERVIIRHANFERTRALYHMQQLRQDPLRRVKTPAAPAPLNPLKGDSGVSKNA